MTPSTFWPGKLLGARFKYPALGRSVQGLGIHECSYLLAAGALRASRFPLGHRHTIVYCRNCLGGRGVAALRYCIIVC